GGTDYFCGPRAAVKPVLPIEDDVLRAFDLIESNRLGIDQPVILSEGRAAAAPKRWRGCEPQLRRIDVDLLHRLAAVLGPFDIDTDRDQQDDADNARGDVARDA